MFVLWSIAGHEVEKREWNGTAAFNNIDDETRRSSSFNGLNSKGLSRQVDFEIDDGDDDRFGVGESSSQSGHRMEEEDGYDKVAEGKENAGDRLLYMTDVHPNNSVRIPIGICVPIAWLGILGLKEDNAEEQFNSHMVVASMENDEEPCSVVFQGSCKLKTYIEKEAEDRSGTLKSNSWLMQH